MSGPLTVALLGCAHGPHAASYAAALAAGDLGRLVAVADSHPALGEPFARAAGVPYHRQAADLLERHRPDAVLVCSITADHRPLVEAAAAHGAAVLCEKPLATTAADAAAIVRACDEAGVQLHTAFVTRFYPVVREVRELVRGGEIGAVRGMVGGNRGRPPLAPRYPAWITDAGQAGGGALIDHSVHVLDAMRFVTGLETDGVLAEVGTLFHDIAVEDGALVSLVFDGGAVGSIDPSWSVPAANPWSYDFYLRILGTDGSLAIASAPEALRVAARQGDRTLVDASFEPDVNRDTVDAFLRSVRAGTLQEPCATGVDGLRAVEVAEAAYRSSRTRRLEPVARATVAGG
ncbi:Gfo/Idh/MocA family protein [Nakamurella endophytica]|uniref:Dehydrogenase n=1 Tax=Nakamurella endophytica TaxID=1748367 RepID=A0A917SUE5_9ACTN|nr:Gfo/Idh/MocA family oxidoreductase [Nakamurella endophytica]GGL98192.1 dehydrogenase [Nakamurella endophytica]